MNDCEQGWLFFINVHGIFFPMVFLYGKYSVIRFNFLHTGNIFFSWKSPQSSVVPLIKLIFFFTTHLKSSNPSCATIYSFLTLLCLMSTEDLLMSLTKVPLMARFFIIYMLLDILLLSVERQCHYCETSIQNWINKNSLHWLNL